MKLRSSTLIALALLAAASSLTRCVALAAESGSSDVDELRTQGTRDFERAMEALADKAYEMDVAWRRFDDACDGAVGTTADGTAVVYTRGWFVLYGPAIVVNDAQCRILLSDAQRLAEEIRAGIDAAEKTARKSWVYPGTMRDIRKRYALYWRDDL